MAMGRSEGVQGDLMATWAELPRSPGHAFYDRLQELLRGAGVHAFVEGVCKPYYAPRMGAPSLPPGRYFRMHMIGYFEGIDSERGIAWRCADSFSLRDFLRLSNREKVPDHSWLSRTRSRLPHEAHDTVFGWVLKLLAERGLVKGERIGIDGSTMEANAALRTIVRRDSGESYRAMLTRMAQESGIETPTAEDLARFDRKRKGKTLSNADWKSPTDPRCQDRQEEGRNDASGLQAGARGRSRHRRRRGGADPSGRRRRCDDAFADAGHRPAQPRRGRTGAERGCALRRRRRQGVSRARTIEGSRRRRVEDAHRRTRAGQGLPALAWRRGGAQSGLRQSRAAEIGYRAGDHAPARRFGRALLRSYPRSRRHASSLAARTGEPPQALPDPCRRVQSRRPDARHLRSGNAEGGCRNPIRPDHRSQNRSSAGLRPDRHRRRRTRRNRHRRCRPDAKLTNRDFVTGLLTQARAGEGSMSSTLRLAKTRPCWNVRAIPRAAIASGGRR